jgi:myo-inositol 2-dehydrogenase/D-chiro-inositol 1-dehydrogenase
MNELRIAVIGAGAMGLDHIIRISTRISGARVSVIIEPSAEKAAIALENAPGAVIAPSLQSAIDQGLVDAVCIVTPGDFHEADIMVALAAQLPIFCEKPLTTSVESALRICEAEEKVGKKLIQVGYTRRFDEGYLQLKEQIESKSLGDLILLHCTHRNPRVPDWYGTEMLIADSVTHEFDIIRFLTGSPIIKVEVRNLKRNTLAPERLKEPILVLVETESGVTAVIEMNVSIQFGYQVITEAVFQSGVAEIGRTQSMNIWQDGRQSQAEHTWYLARFAQAYDSEIQRWVDAARNGGIDGPCAWDGYISVSCVQAGLASMKSGGVHAPQYLPRPAFYNE